ncbi:MAG: hypothetical protein CME62_08390 [Halobacteriovoraceae bacterium]|nr:hypothetical protein [Halobacteriovoraceae bacterium]|tara:strand:- start:7897 stop:8439 length:543 start_codon:yes stop_codon:yes gene_type:complete
MAYRTPTSRKAKRTEEGINLIPILDAVFIFIFFLLMSTQFVKIFEIGSDVPIVSTTPPPKDDKPPFMLTLVINKNNILVQLQNSRGGTKDRNIEVRNIEGEYDLDTLHNELVKIKKQNLGEEQVILEPKADLSYEEIVLIMDATRKLRNTDETMFKKDKDGIDVQVRFLFHKIIFGNIMS